MTAALIHPDELARNLAALAFADEIADFETCLRIATRAVLNAPPPEELMLLVAGDAACASACAAMHRNHTAIARQCGFDPSEHELAAERWSRVALSGAGSEALN